MCFLSIEELNVFSICFFFIFSTSLVLAKVKLLRAETLTNVFPVAGTMPGLQWVLGTHLLKEYRETQHVPMRAEGEKRSTEHCRTQ